MQKKQPQKTKSNYCVLWLQFQNNKCWVKVFLQKKTDFIYNLKNTAINLFVCIVIIEQYLPLKNNDYAQKKLYDIDSGGSSF